MNANRRTCGELLIVLLVECSEIGQISDESHLVATTALAELLSEEQWQLRRQEKHAGSNDSTDKQIAICRVAIPALEKAVAAWNSDDYATVIENLRLAIDTDGTPPAKPKRRRRKP